MWVFDVQAHAPATAPFANSVEDGQFEIIRPNKREDRPAREG
jgi:hypothetical protein